MTRPLHVALERFRDTRPPSGPSSAKMKTRKRDGWEYPSRPLIGKITVNDLTTPRHLRIRDMPSAAC